MSHIISSAFSSFPSKQRGGALTTKGYLPLTLHAVQVDVKIIGFCVQVQLHLECINETSENQKVIMVYPVPLQWQLMHCQVGYDGFELSTSFESCRIFNTTEAASGVGTLSSPDGKVWRVASQYIPWELMVGTSIHAVATYHVPLPCALKSDAFEFSLPPELFPSMERPHETVLAYNMLFQLKTNRVLKAGITINIDATLFHPLRGEVKLLREDCLAGNEEDLTSGATIEYNGDVGFSLHYSEKSTTKMLYQPFLLYCPIAPTLEPLRLFAEVEKGAASEVAGNYAVGISFAPLRGERYNDEINAELIFVLDTHSIESSKAMAEALRAVLPGLPSSVKVNIIFPRYNGEDVVVFIEGSQPLDAVNIEQLTAYVEQLTPQPPRMGSSRLPTVLEGLFREQGGRGGGKIPSGYARNIILLCDEGVKAGVAGAQLARAAVYHANKIRISALGLTFSSLAEVPVLSLLARETGGIFQEADTPEKVPEALVRVVAAAAVPTLTNITISIPTEESVGESAEGQEAEGEGGEAEAPAATSTTSTTSSTTTSIRRSFGKKIAVIPVGQQRHFYLMVPASAPPVLRVVIAGFIGDVLSEFNCECRLTEAPFTSQADLKSPTSLGLLHLTAAAARTVHLVDSDVGCGSALTKEAVEEVKKLSLACFLPTPFTQLVQRASNVPVVAAQTPALTVSASYVSVTATYAPLLEDHEKLLYAYDNHKKPLRPSERPIAACMPSTRHFTYEFVHTIVLDFLRKALCPADIHRLIPLQGRDGAFAFTSVFCTCVGVNKATLQAAIPEDLLEHEEWWATAIALAAAQGFQSPLTTLMERQASRFLRQCSAGSPDILDWKGWVKTATAALSEALEKSREV